MDARAATIPLECHPILTKDGSDSTSLDEVVELLARNGPQCCGSGADVAASRRPPAGIGLLSATHADCVEPWDGPAALPLPTVTWSAQPSTATACVRVAFSLPKTRWWLPDRKPAWSTWTPRKSSTAAVWAPAKCWSPIWMRTSCSRMDQLLKEFDRSPATRNWWRIPRSSPPHLPQRSEELIPLQQLFGYTREDVRMVLAPMAADGKDAVWSMGDDTPLAPLAHAPRPVYAFFRQRFAQVTNPAIDPVRESIVIQLHTRLGPWPHITPYQGPHSRLSLESPFLSLGQMHTLRNREHPLADEMPLGGSGLRIRAPRLACAGPSTTCARAPLSWCAAGRQFCC